MAKRVIDGLSDIDRGLMLEGWAQSQLFQSEDFMEGIQSFMKGTSAAFTRQSHSYSRQPKIASTLSPKSWPENNKSPAWLISALK
jgi:hypothetical protein